MHAWQGARVPLQHQNCLEVCGPVRRQPPARIAKGQPVLSLLVTMPLLEAYALGQMATFMLVIHWVSFVYAMYIGSELYYDATGIGCIAFMAVLSAFKSGTFFPRQVRSAVGRVGRYVGR